MGPVMLRQGSGRRWLLRAFCAVWLGFVLQASAVPAGLAVRAALESALDADEGSAQDGLMSSSMLTMADEELEHLAPSLLTSVATLAPSIAFHPHSAPREGHARERDKPPRA